MKNSFVLRISTRQQVTSSSRRVAWVGVEKKASRLSVAHGVTSYNGVIAQSPAWLPGYLVVPIRSQQY